MAKQSTTKTGTSRIRFIMVDAEVSDGDLSQITSAIQNALKPTTTIIQQRLPSNTGQLPVDVNGVDGEIFDEESFEVDVNETPVPKPSKPARVRKPTTPEVIDFDFDSDVSLVSFAGQLTTSSEPERNLVIAAWFKEHRATSSITAGHVYTGYRKLGWSAGFEDFSWPLRSLKKERLMSSSSRGFYDINHLGLDKVKKLGAGG